MKRRHGNKRSKKRAAAMRRRDNRWRDIKLLRGSNWWGLGSYGGAQGRDRAIIAYCRQDALLTYHRLCRIPRELLGI